MNRQQTLEGKCNVGASVYIRLITEADTDLIVRWRNLEHVRNHFIYRETFTRQIHENWLKTKVQTGQVVQFIICLTATDQPIGSVYLRDINSVHQKAEYGIFIGEEEALGKGYGTEATKLAVQYGFEQLQLHRIMLRVLADNIAAQKSYEKAGFCKEAYLKEDVKLDGIYRDVILMAVINPYGFGMEKCENE